MLFYTDMSHSYFLLSKVPGCLIKSTFQHIKQPTGYSSFPLSSKTNTSKFQFDLERTDTFKRAHMNSYVLRG